MTRLRHHAAMLLISTVTISVLTACGQKGALYLPEQLTTLPATSSQSERVEAVFESSNPNDY